MKWKKKLLIGALVNVILMVITLNINQDNFNKDSDTQNIISKLVPDNLTVKAEVTPYHQPTSDPIILLFIWLTSGYNLQPENQYTYVNNPKTMYTDSGRSVVDALLGLLSTPHYTWYQSTDGKNWTQMSQTTKELTVTPSKVGTIYYQQMTRWYGLIPGLLDTIVYSKVAFVTAFPSPIEATSLDVIAESNYLYNNQSSVDTTYVVGTPTPYNATGNVTWKVNDTSLATVDTRTGLVTANTTGKSGTVRVTGTMTNSNGTSVSNYVDIKIGGGLDDQTVDEGQKATFEVQGNFGEPPTNVVWHKVDAANKDTVVTNSSSNKLIYTTPNTVYATDNGTKYYAVLTITSGDSTTTVTTNRANLSVRKNVLPAVTISNTIFNNSYDDHNISNTLISNVSENDQVSYKVDLSDSNINSSMSKVDISFKLPATSIINNLKLNGQDFADYSYTSDSNGKSSTLVVKNINFSTIKKYSLEVNSTIGENDDPLFSTTTTVVGYDANNSVIGNYNAGELTMNFAANSISMKAQDWDYGSINSYNSKILLDRKKIENDHLEVTDNRREKKALKLYLAQSNPFKSGENVLPSEMRYYQKDGGYSVLDSTGTLVSETIEGQTLGSIMWSDDEGPKLFIMDGISQAGNYSTTLEWSLVESI